MGREVKLPPQFGQICFKVFSTQLTQKVHSNVHIIASSDSGGKSLLQHSQLGLSSNMVFPFFNKHYPCKAGQFLTFSGVNSDKLLTKLLAISFAWGISLTPGAKATIFS